MKTKVTKSATSSRSEQKYESADHVAAGEKAFATMEAKLLALSSDGLDRVNIDIQVAAVTALAVANAITADPVLRGRFEALAKAKEFDLAKLDSLGPSALAAWFARHRFLLADATHSDAQLPLDVVTSATTLKTRMMRVVDYHLGDHPVAGPVIAAIRLGTGYMDLANDLVSLASLYATYVDLLAHDQKDYKAGDQALAAKTGDQIITLLGGTTPEQRTWADRQARAFTLLNANYAEVSAAGRYLKRADSDVDSMFPSLIAASRAAASRSPAPAEPVPPVANGSGGTATAGSTAG